jgi:hypothetical protein
VQQQFIVTSFKLSESQVKYLLNSKDVCDFAILFKGQELNKCFVILKAAEKNLPNLFLKARQLQQFLERLKGEPFEKQQALLSIIAGLTPGFLTFLKGLDLKKHSFNQQQSQLLEGMINEHTKVINASSPNSKETQNSIAQTALSAVQTSQTAEQKIAAWLLKRKKWNIELLIKSELRAVGGQEPKKLLRVLLRFEEGVNQPFNPYWLNSREKYLNIICGLIDVFESDKDLRRALENPESSLRVALSKKRHPSLNLFGNCCKSGPTETEKKLSLMP